MSYQDDEVAYLSKQVTELTDAVRARDDGAVGRLLRHLVAEAPDSAAELVRQLGAAERRGEAERAARIEPDRAAREYAAEVVRADWTVATEVATEWELTRLAVDV